MTSEKRSDLNGLTAAEWIPLTTSVFSVPNHEPGYEVRRAHPATFNVALAERMIRFLSKPGDTVLDPFSGTGATVIAAAKLGRIGIGIELYQKWIDLTHKVIAAEYRKTPTTKAVQSGLGRWSEDEDLKDPVSERWDDIELLRGDSTKTMGTLGRASVDFLLCSPPYADILSQRLTGGSKLTRQRLREEEGLALSYGDDKSDIGRMDLEAWLEYMRQWALTAAIVVKPGKFMTIVVQNIVTKDGLIPLAWRLGETIGAIKEWSLHSDNIWHQKHKAGRIAGWPSNPMQSNHHNYVLIFRRLPNE